MRYTKHCKSRDHFTSSFTTLPFTANEVPQYTHCLRCSERIRSLPSYFILLWHFGHWRRYMVRVSRRGRISRLRILPHPRLHLRASSSLSPIRPCPHWQKHRAQQGVFLMILVLQVIRILLVLLLPLQVLHRIVSLPVLLVLEQIAPVLVFL